MRKNSEIKKVDQKLQISNHIVLFRLQKDVETFFRATHIHFDENCARIILVLFFDIHKDLL